MANEEQPAIETRITDNSKAYEDMSAFYLQETFSDIRITVQGKTFPAHKIVLAARCRFFENMLSLDPTKSELTLHDVSSTPFLNILEYLYTGSVTFLESNQDLVFDVINLAHEYSLNSLKIAISQNLKSSVCMQNVTTLLNKAILYHMEDLKDLCLEFIDDHVFEVLDSDFFNVLSQKSMVKLLERDSFPVPEIDIFQIVEKWCRSHTDTDGLVVKCIRLTLLTRKEIISTVRQSGLINDDVLFGVLEELEEGNLNAQPRIIVSTPDENIATAEHKTRVVRGENYEGNDNLKYILHKISDGGGITVDLRTIRGFNHIHMKLEDSSNNSYRYCVEVSINQKTWNRVIDYSGYTCRSIQNLYFNEQKARYIRIVGTFASAGNDFRLEYFEVYFKSEIPKVINCVIRPEANVATVEMGAKVIEGGFDDLLRDNNSYVSGHAIGSGHTVIQFGQPYLVSNLKLSLEGASSFKYFIETSVNSKNWDTVDQRNQPCSSWQTHEFTERVVVFFRITGTYACNILGLPLGTFSCSRFLCPAK